MSWSPDSKKLLWSDKLLRLQYVDIDSKEVTLVDQAKDWEFGQYSWSPDSKWITYARPDRTAQPKIYIYDVASKNKYPVTDGWYESADPRFSSDGKYLFFTSNRDFNPTYSWTEWNHSYADMAKIYFVTLAKATPNPFAPEDDEVAIKKVEKEDAEAKPENKDVKKDEKKEGGHKAAIDVKIDLDGLIDRIVALPIDASNYYDVNAVDDNVYYVKGGRGGDHPSLKMYNP